MSEIKREIIPREDGSILIEEGHTIADIARWIIKNDWLGELLFCIEGETEKCPTCGESEPGTGNCGTSDSDTKALCKVQSECSCRNESQECTEASNCRVLRMFEPTITAVAQEPVHFRAVLCREQQDQAIGVVPKVVGFVDKKAAEQFILEKRDFQGWRYNLEPLYTEAPAVAVNEQMLAALKELMYARTDKAEGMADAAIAAAEAAKGVRNE